MSQSNFSWIALQVQGQRDRWRSQTAELPFADVLSSETVQSVAREAGFHRRQCGWSPQAILWTFLWQALGADHSCRAAVSRFVLCCAL
jgi:hypothetical protein